MFTSAMRSRSASVRYGGTGSRSSVTAAPGPAACEAAADSRQSEFRSGGADIESNRPREVEHLVDDAVEPLDFFVDIRDGFVQRRVVELLLPQRVQRALDDHQRIPHFVRDDRGKAAERRAAVPSGTSRAGTARPSRSAC